MFLIPIIYSKAITATTIANSVGKTATTIANAVTIATTIAIYVVIAVSMQYFL